MNKLGVDIDWYLNMLHRYEAGDVDLTTTQREFFQRFKLEPGPIPDQVYSPLQRIFETLDAVDESLAPEDEVVPDISPATARVEIISALRALERVAG